MKKTIILAGGFGTRLRSRVSDLPKALAPINGKPFLSYQLEWLRKQGIKEVYIATHHLAGHISEFIKHQDFADLAIKCVYEDFPLGTGGAILNVIKSENITEEFIVINGDTKHTADLKNIFKNYKPMKGECLLFASYSDEASRYGILNVNGDFVTEFLKPNEEFTSGWVNSGLYIFSPLVFESFKIEKISLEENILPNLANKERLRIYKLNCDRPFIDIGTPESFDKINNNKN